MSDLELFTPEGVLPPRDHVQTLSQLRESMLVVGGGSATWDAAWRRRLVDNLTVLVGQLWAVGIEEIFINGSFVEDKDHPNDIDGYFVCEESRIRSRSLQRDLNRLDPAKCWTWDHAARRPYRGYPKLQLPMWHAYRVELYPHWSGLIAGTDSRGHELEFPSFFRQSRATGLPKGIVKVVK